MATKIKLKGKPLPYEIEQLREIEHDRSSHPDQGKKKLKDGGRAEGHTARGRHDRPRHQAGGQPRPANLPSWAPVPAGASLPAAAPAGRPVRPATAGATGATPTAPSVQQQLQARGVSPYQFWGAGRQLMRQYGIAKKGGNADGERHEKRQVGGNAPSGSVVTPGVEPRPVGQEMDRAIASRTRGAGAAEAMERPHRAEGGRLTAAKRRAMPSSEFALPGKGEGPEGKQAGAYPIDTPGRARSALSRGKQHAPPSELATIRRKVHAKYPDMEISGKD